MAALLVPENAGEVLSWREHYCAVRRRWYIGLALWAVAIALNATVNLRFPLARPSRGIQAFSLSVGLAGAVSSDDRVHNGLAVLIALAVLALMFTIGFSPGWLLRM
jgi:hypothetical protein